MYMNFMYVSCSSEKLSTVPAVFGGVCTYWTTIVVVIDMVMIVVIVRRVVRVIVQPQDTVPGRISIESLLPRNMKNIV